MIRFVILGLIVLVVWFLIMRAVRFAQTREIDWTGIALMVAFVMLAFYLRHTTGIG
ncbi:MAG: hypothetical protein KF874_06650 [Rhizobiaceae bacterium]|nr:hypothetical protein [Rhizobiaceae bacterium]